jgi:hypothetical protein
MNVTRNEKDQNANQNSSNLAHDNSRRIILGFFELLTRRDLFNAKLTQFNRKDKRDECKEIQQNPKRPRNIDISLPSILICSEPEVK